MAAHRPTLLIDEADTFARDNDELRGILNSGHRQGGHVLRAVGDEHEPRAFKTYSAVAIACIGNLPDTLIDRSVVVDLKRRKPSEPITPFRLDRTEALDVLARKIARWKTDKADAVAAIDPEMPPGIVNRVADNWRPLAAIAAAVGDEWPARARSAMLASNPGASLIETLRIDIRDIFGSGERKASVDLIEALCEIEPRPWSEFGKSGKPITQNKLARLLKPLGIAPQLVRLPGLTDPVRGYIRAHFEEAFDRYLTPQEPKEGSSNRYSVTNPIDTGTSDIFQTVTSGPDVTDRKSEKSNNDGLCNCCNGCEGGKRAR